MPGVDWMICSATPRPMNPAPTMATRTGLFSAWRFFNALSMMIMILNIQFVRRHPGWASRYGGYCAQMFMSGQLASLSEITLTSCGQMIPSAGSLYRRPRSEPGWYTCETW